MEKTDVKEGTILTVDSLIVGIGGGTIFEKGQKIKVIEVKIRPGYWSRFHSCYVPDEITGVIVEENYGVVWDLDMFEEFKTDKK